MNYSKIILKNTKWIYISKLFTVLINLIVNILVIRELDIEVFGKFSFFINTVLFVNLLSLSSVSSVFNRFIPEISLLNDISKIKKLIKGGIIFSIIVFSFLFVLVYFYQDRIVLFFKIDDFRFYSTYFIILLVVSFLKTAFDSASKALLLHNKIAKVIILNSILRSILYITLLTKLNIQILLIIEIILGLIYFIIVVLILNNYFRYYSSKQILKTDKPITKKRILRFGSYSALNEIGSGIVGKASDFFIIGAIANPYSLGLYAFAFKLFEYAFKLLPMKDFLTIVRPIFIQKFSTSTESDDFEIIFNFLVKLMLPIYVLPGLVFFLFGQDFISIVFQNEYKEAYLITTILLLGNLVPAFFYPTTLTMVLKERMDISLISKITVVFSIFGGIYAMIHFGIVGVIIVTVIGDIIRNMVIFLLLKHEVNLPYKIKDYLKFGYNLIIPTIIFIPFMGSITNIFQLIFMSFIFVCLYFISFIFINPYNEDEQKIFIKISNNSKILKQLHKIIILLSNIKIKLR